MSVVSSVLSTRSTGWRINVRFSSLMDSIFAIGFGLGLRFVVDTVSHQNFKLTGTLVGLWEGVIMLHFLKKMPKSSDPYIAYGVRIFIDFLFTESLARTVLVLIWTALGMVLADITPAIWDDVGLKRIWKGFRRDLYTISRIIPTVAFFPPARTVRFSPSREPSVIVEPTEVLSPSEITNQEPPSIIEPPFAPASRDASKRRLPGYFHLDYSDTETDAGSVRIDEYTAPGRTSRRLSVYPQSQDFDDTTSDLSNPQDELDDANLSSLPSDVTETAEPTSALPDASEIPEMHVDEEPLLIDTAATAVKPEDGEVTPTQGRHIFMPPTPSDSAPDRRFGRRRDNDEPLPVRPPSEFLPQIPDFLEEATTEDWEKIEKPPTPPAKDRPVGFTIPKVPVIPPPQPPTAEQSHPAPAPKEEEGWDTLDSQILMRPPEGNSETDLFTNNETTNRDSQLPAYDDVNFDDIYDDPPRHAANDLLTGNLIDTDNMDLPPAHVQQTDAGAGSLPPLFDLEAPLGNPWDSATSGPHEAIGDSTKAMAATWEAENARLQEQQEQVRVAEEAAQAERARQEEEEEKRKRDEAAKEKEKERKAQERKAKKEADKAEMAKKEKEDAIARKKRVAEAEEAEKKKKEQQKKDAEDARVRREEAAKKKAEEAEKKRKEEAEKKRKEEAEKIRKKEEAEKQRKEDEEKKEAARRAEEEEEAARRKEEEEKEAARRKEKEEEEAARRKEEEEERRKEEAEKKRQEEENEKKRQEEEEEKGRRTEELRLEDEKRSQELEQQRLIDEADKQTQEEEKLKEETTNQEEREEEEEAQIAKTEAEAQNTTTDGNNIKQENQDQMQDDAALTQDHIQEQLTPTMASRKLDENLQSQLDAEEAPATASVLDVVEEQSVISDAPPPLNPEFRVERMLSLRAQMVDIQVKIEETKIAGSDCSALEKALRKMERQAQRRYDAGISLAGFPKDQTTDVQLDILNAQRSSQKVAEKIEQLLIPTSQKLALSVTFGKKPMQSKLQKPAIANLLNSYNLLEYSTDVGKKTIIDVPENDFADWVTGYRKLSTQEREDDRPTLWR